MVSDCSGTLIFVGGIGFVGVESRVNVDNLPWNCTLLLSSFFAYLGVCFVGIGDLWGFWWGVGRLSLSSSSS